MIREERDINWQEILNQYSSHEGTIIDFCKANNIKPYQLYYQRKAQEKDVKSIFHAIPLAKKEVYESVVMDTSINQSTNIRIEIGEINVYIPLSDKTAVINIIKELSKSC